MMPQLSEAFGLTTMGWRRWSASSTTATRRSVSSPVSPWTDWGHEKSSRSVQPRSASAHCCLPSGNAEAANVGRFLQGAGGVFALVGAAYIATTNFPASRAATLIGATQMFGMAGGSAGQFVVGPVIASGVNWNVFWLFMGVAGIAISVVLVRPASEIDARPASDDWMKGATRALVTVFRNPQSILCGMISGLLFIPTTIFDMIWGVRYLQEARGFDYGSAVMHSAMVPVGWIIGCPLLGFVSDAIGRRKPVIIASALVLLGCLAWILFGPPACSRRMCWASSRGWCRAPPCCRTPSSKRRTRPR